MRFVAIVDPFSSAVYLPEELRHRGYESISILSRDNTPDIILSQYHRKDFALEIIYNNDINRIVSILKYLNIEAVIPGVDSAVELSDNLSKLLALAGNNPINSNIRHDKQSMHKALSDHGISVPSSYLNKDPIKIVEWSENKNFPIVVKPTNSAGGDLVFLCRNKEDLLKKSQSILDDENVFGNKNKNVFAQEYIGGVEFAIDSVSMDGNHTITNIFIYDKVIIDNKNFVYRSVKNFIGDKSLISRIESFVENVLNILDVRFGAAHTEIKIFEEHLYFIEIGARMNGGGMPTLIKKIAEWSQIDLLIDSYINKDLFLKKSSSPLILNKNIMVHCVISNYSGKVGMINSDKKITEMESHLTSLWHIKEGGRVHKTIDLATCPLKVILSHENMEKINFDHDRLISMEKNNELFEIIKDNSKEN